MRKEKVKKCSSVGLETQPPTIFVDLSKFTRLLLASFGSLILLLLQPVQLRAGNLKPIVDSRVRISPPLTGRHGLIDLSIDRDKPADLVACGYRVSAPQSAYIGFVYRSHDNGHTWQDALKDDSSYWVSEESCASGAGGRVFFMAESQLLDYGKVRSSLPLQKRGELRLYRSSDGGLSWEMLRQPSWLDHTAMAIDWSHGARRGRMYLFGTDEGRDKFGSFRQLQVMTSDDGEHLHGPVSLPDPTDFKYVGAYASAARVLPDGDVLAIFSTRRGHTSSTGKIDQPFVTHVEAFATRDGGETLKSIADFGSVDPCLGTQPSLDTAEFDQFIYAVWGTLKGRHCQLMISSSADGGETWSASQPVGVANDGYVPSIAVNRDGIVGLFWTDNTESHCWKFAASSDKAKTFSEPVTVSRCVSDSKIGNLAHSSYVTPSVHQRREGQGWTADSDAIGFSVVAARDGMFPERTGLAADSSGAFRAVWPEPTDQDGALWSATISVNGAQERTSGVAANVDVSHNVALEFVNSEFDKGSNTYAVDVVATNTSTTALQGPLILRMETAYSRFFESVTAIGTDNGVESSGAAWTVWPEENNDSLAPGKHTAARRLSFLLTRPISDPVAFGDLLAVKMKAFIAK